MLTKFVLNTYDTLESATFRGTNFPVYLINHKYTKTLNQIILKKNQLKE